MRNALLIFVLLAVAAIQVDAQDVKIDFSNPAISELKVSGKAKVEDSVLKINNGGNATFEISRTNPIKISFRVRVTKNMKASNPSAWRFYLHGKDNESGMFNWRSDNQLESYFYKNSQRKGGMIKNFTFIENEWMNVEIVLLKNIVSVKIDGKEIGNEKHPGFLPLKEIKFEAYNLDWELDDLSVTDIPQEKQQTVENPVFSLDFNETLEAQNENGEKTSPASAENYQLVPGIEGTGLVVKAGKKGGVSYSLNKPFNSKVGGIMFWVKANQQNGGQLFSMTDGKQNKLAASIGGDKRININVNRTDIKQGLGYTRSFPGELGDWVLVALTWDEESNSKFFINTLPYLVCFNAGQRMPDFLNADVDGIQQLNFISNNKGDFTIDRLRFFKRTLKNSDVYDEYRRFMPFDMVMERTIVPANAPAKLSVQVAPGGFYTRPAPVEKSAFVTGKGEFHFQLKDKNGNILLDETKTADINAPMDIMLKDVTLETGSYTLECVVNNAYKRSFAIDSFTSDYKAVPTKADIKVGKLLFSKKLDNATDPSLLTQGVIRIPDGKAYLEAGQEKTDRFSFEIPFSNDQLGKPVVLDITWPDDKLRMMGWYMYPYGVGANRDRLQSGIQAGNEIPNSGKMITTRHIFYPGISKYLFEARTMATGMPAAVAEINIYEIDGGLPALAIHRPENMQGRNFGFTDEDQTFTNNLNVDVTIKKSPVYQEYIKKYPSQIGFFTDEVMRYFNYTGMNSMHTPLWRYVISYFPVEGQTSNGMFPGGGGTLGYVFDAFAKNDKKFIAMMNYANLPDISHLDKIESTYREEGLETLDKYGDSIVRYLAGLHRANICHPKVLSLFASYFEEPVKRYSKVSGFDGMEYSFNFGNWGSLDYGYDDYTVNKFSRETGVKVPEKLKERYAYLTTEKREQWLKWRSEQVTNIVKMFRSILDKYNPGLKLFLCIGQDPENYEKYGIDLAEIKKIPNVSISVGRYPTSYRHAFHWGKAETTLNEELYDFNNKDIQNYLMDGAAGVVTSGNAYFETFVHPLSKEYPCYFENADIKPHSRFYLREPAFAVGAFDAQEYVAGGQPLPTIGRDAEAREFAQAYCALPAKKFSRVEGITDPVVARYLHTENGTYFYAVNMFHDEVKVKLDFGKDIPYLDLSTDKMENGSIITLKPFQLRSFLFPKQKVEIRKLEFASVGSETVPFYKKRIAALKNAADALAKGNIDISAERQDIALLESALAANQFAELTRVAFSRRMNQLLEKEKNITNYIKRQQMIDKGQYAVNCGSPSFYTAPDGKFFFPDQRFDGTYGYFGKYESITRDISQMKGTDLPELYKTEAYSLDGYRFKVPNGTYKVVMYIKAGFSPNFKPAVYRFTILINGKPVLNRIDLHEVSGGDFNKALKFEMSGISVDNGELVIKYQHNPDERDKTANTTVCLANAIEITKE